LLYDRASRSRTDLAVVVNDEIASDRRTFGLDCRTYERAVNVRESGD